MLVFMPIVLITIIVGCGGNDNVNQPDDTQPQAEIYEDENENEEVFELEIEEPTGFIFDTKEGILFMENVKSEYDKNGKYYAYADTAIENLLTNFWHERRNIFYDGYPQKTASAFHYWWYAHGIDALADAYIRTGNEKYKEYADIVLGTIVRRNNGITNDYYDDMLWMAIALLRFYDATGEEKYKEYVEILWEDIKRGWNDNMGGGIAWRKSQLDYKNTPSNAPAVILAARMYRLFKNPEDFEWAKKIYEYQKETLVDKVTGQVWDGINREGNGRIDKNWNFTYCHGVYIGAGVELYKITGEEVYLDDAKKTANYALNTFFNERNGTFTESGEGDGGLFKGIMTRYMTELYLISPDMSGIKSKLEMCAETLRESGTTEEGLFAKNGYRILRNGDGYDLSTQLSGVMLYEMMAVIEGNVLSKEE